MCAKKTNFPYVNNLLHAATLFTKMTRFAKIKHQAVEKGYTIQQTAKIGPKLSWSVAEGLIFLSPKNS